MFTRSARFYDAIYSFKDYARESRVLEDIISAEVPRARTLLDVACGTGLHLQHLGARFEVTGVDIDPELLQIAAQRNPGIALEQADMTDFDLGRRFDVVTCLFSSIGYVRTPDRLRMAAAALAGHVAPGGILMVEPWIFPEQFESGRADTLLVDFDGGKIVRATFSERRQDESVLDLHYLVRDPAGRVTHLSEQHVLGLFSDEQYRAALEGSGLGDVSFDPEGLMGRGLYISRRPH
ncbi:MAG: class I SAM-dependent methyltransferase [Actinomycetota bacterium]|nr:class I SAM-dependent methyltransferase [Actinomycetota bacterium]